VGCDRLHRSPSSNAYTDQDDAERHHEAAKPVFRRSAASNNRSRATGPASAAYYLVWPLLVPVFGTATFATVRQGSAARTLGLCLATLVITLAVLALLVVVFLASGGDTGCPYDSLYC
jgi:hypothetical protein